LSGHTDDVFSAAFSPDSRFVATAGKDGTTRLWESSTGKELCRLISFRDGSWVVVDPEGRFDANNLEEIQGLHWIFPDEPFRPLPLEVFMREYYEPRLLQRILAGERFRPVRSLGDLNRVQPEVKITSIKEEADSPDWVAVTVEVRSVQGKKRRGAGEVMQASGAYDLRIYRDHQLVKQDPAAAGDYQAYASNNGSTNPSEELELWRRSSAVTVDATGHARRTFRVRLPHRTGMKSVQLSAYAFNRDRVKSATAQKTYAVTRPLAPMRGRAFVITVGVAKNENSHLSLVYPANDAHLLSSVLTKTLEDTRQYREVVPVALVSSDDDLPTDEPLPKKANLRTVLEVLAGKTVERSRLESLPAALRRRLQPVEPEDLVVITFSGHGNTDSHGIFYLYPYDLGMEEKIPTQRLIASGELAGWLRDIDAADIAMILDACRSGAATGADFKPGPMGDRGLGQLAYDKGMQILAAAPGDKDTLSIGQLHHGLLTYALAHDGLQEGLALGKNKTFVLADWLRYGVERVPELFKQIEDPASRQESPHPALFDFAQRTAVLSGAQ
jgi:WD domain, G-beta repeat/Caspase domain